MDDCIHDVFNIFIAVYHIMQCLSCMLFCDIHINLTFLNFCDNMSSTQNFRRCCRINIKTSFFSICISVSYTIVTEGKQYQIGLFV